MKNVKNVCLVIALLFVCFANTGCLPVAAVALGGASMFSGGDADLSSPRDVVEDVSVFSQGSPEKEVLSKAGTPKQVLVDERNKKVVIYDFKTGTSSKALAARKLGYKVAGFLSMGTVTGESMEKKYGEAYRIKVSYIYSDVERDYVIKKVDNVDKFNNVVVQSQKDS